MDEILEILPIGVFVLDAEFRVTETNKTLEEFFGFSRAEMLGQDKRRLLSEKIARIFENGDDFRSRVLATYDDNTYIERFVCHVLAGDHREERWLQHTSQPIVTGTHKGGRIESYSDVTDLVLAEQEIHWLTTQSMQLLEKEKSRIAGNLHDELGQTILAVKLCLENLQTSLKKHGGSLRNENEELQKSLEWIEKIGIEVRDISSDLMPPLLGPLGLDETLAWLKDQYCSLYGLDISLQIFGVCGKRLPESLEVAIFRVFQESLNNIVKHASAQHVILKLVYSYPKILVTVTDDGKGFDPENHNAVGIGLKLMRQRILEWNGRMKITSEIDRGTTIRAEFLVPDERHEKVQGAFG